MLRFVLISCLVDVISVEKNVSQTPAEGVKMLICKVDDDSVWFRKKVLGV